MAEDLSRRRFFTVLLRLAAFGGIGALAARLLGGTPARPGETCVNEGLCRGCGVYPGCGLPQALSARDSARGG